MEKQNRHYFCDRAARSWMPAKKNQVHLNYWLETKAVCSFNPNFCYCYMCFTLSQPYSWTRCCGFAACLPCLSELGAFSGLVCGNLLPFCQDFNLVDFWKWIKLVPLRSSFAAQVNEFSSVPRSCTFLPRDLWLLQNSSSVERGREEQIICVFFPYSLP